MAIRSLTTDDVALYRTLRLRALASNPAAFGSNHARESAFDDETWRSRLRGFAGRPGVVLIDESDDRQAAGMVGVGESEQVGEAVVWGMWVDPDNRGSGVGRRLLTTAVDWARDRGCTAVLLSVHDGNDLAASLYRSAGFVEVDRRDGESILRLELTRPLWVETTGEGPAILFIHSAVCDARMWEPQWQHYRRSHTVARVDLQGFGRTGLGSGVVRHAEDLLSTMDRLGLDSATLVGNSLGGRVALELAVTASERVDALMLAAPPMYGHEWSAAVQDFGRAEDEALEAGDIDRAVQLNVSLWLDGPNRDRADVSEEIRRLVADMQRTSFQHLLPRLDDAHEEATVPDLRDRLGSIAVPTMVVVGEHDVDDMRDIGQTIVDSIDGARLAMQPGVAHLPSLEAPDDFNLLLDELLNTVPRPLDGDAANR